MGIDIYTYIGAYVNAPKVMSTVKEEKYHCPNNGCKNHKGMAEHNNFCPICGSEGITTTTEKQAYDYLDFDELATKYNLKPDGLMRFNENQYIPNRSLGGVSVNYSNRDDITNIEIETDDVLDSLDSFKDVFSDYIDAVEKEYNIDLQVKFGVVTYYA